MKNLLILLAIALTVGCATKPEDIQAVYYPDEAYQNHTCDALRAEMGQIQSRVLQATGQQRKQRKNDQIWGWTGALLFAPALFAIGGNDENAALLAQLKGQYEAIDRTYRAKACAG